MRLKAIKLEYYLIGYQKVTAMRCKYFVFSSAVIFWTEMVYNFLNNKYYRTGVGLMHSLGEIELRQTVREVFFFIKYGNS